MKVLNLGGAVGPDAKTVINEEGGKQSETAFRLDLVPPFAYLALGEVLALGAEKYGEENWRKIPDPREHLNHALIHAASYLARDTSEGDPLQHLARAFCRMAFALELAIIDKIPLDIPFDRVAGTIGKEQR